MSSGTTDS